jgi:hypothetical protein
MCSGTSPVGRGAGRKPKTSGDRSAPMSMQTRWDSAGGSDSAERMATSSAGGTSHLTCRCLSSRHALTGVAPGATALATWVRDGGGSGPAPVRLRHRGSAHGLGRDDGSQSDEPPRHGQAGDAPCPNRPPQLGRPLARHRARRSGLRSHARRVAQQTGILTGFRTPSLLICRPGTAARDRAYPLRRADCQHARAQRIHRRRWAPPWAVSWLVPATRARSSAHVGGDRVRTAPQVPQGDVGVAQPR